MRPTVCKMVIRKPLVIAVAAVLLYGLTGFFAVPALLQWRLPLLVERTLQCRATVEKIRINPFLLSLEVEGFSLNQADGALLASFSRFFADLETSSLFRRAIVLRELTLDKPDIHLVIEADSSLNVAKLAAKTAQPPEPAPAESSLFPFILQVAAIQNGTIHLTDQRQSTSADCTLQGLTLQMRDLATVKDHNGAYQLAVATPEQESLQATGEFSLVPLRVQGTLGLNAIRTASLWRFFRDSLNLEQPAGTIDLATSYQMNGSGPRAQMALTDFRFSTSDLSFKLVKSEKPFFQLKKMELSAPRLDLTAGELHVDRLLLEEGAVDARINDAGGVNMQQIVRESPVKAPEKNTQPAVALVAGQKDASASPSAPSLLKLRADAVEIKRLAIDLDDSSHKVPFKAAIAGVDLHLRASMALGGGKPAFALEEIATALNGVKVFSSKAKEPLFATDKLVAEGGSVDLATQTATIVRVALTKGRLDAGREADGTFNWQQLFAAKGAAAKSPGPKTAPAAAPTWKFLVKSFEVEGFGSRYSDLTTRSDKPVFSVQNLNAKLTGIDGKSPMSFTAGFQVEQGGNAKVSGTVHPTVPAVEAEVNLNGVALTSLQPYLEPFVTLKMQSAQISTRGRLAYGLPKSKQQTLYEGNFSLDKLNLTEAKAKKPYLSCDSVRLPQLRLSLQPNTLEAREIVLSKPVGELIIGPDKTLNLAKVIKEHPGGNAAKPTGKPKVKPIVTSTKPQGGKDDFTYQIGKIQVENGNFVFADLSLRPQFMTRIHDLKGTVSNLSSAKESQATVRMDGQVDQYGTAKITGVLRPSDFARASDMNLVFHNLEMKNLSPYSGKFAGRLIKSGKFSADLNYKLVEYKMTGDNKIVIDNLTLGDKVEDPEATSLPLDLAIALLKDANGRIDVGLPVTGDLDDPQFRIGSLIWKVVTNLITKATTAPFRALGSLLGGSEETFDALAFDPGSFELPPPEKEKLLKVAGALKSRPQLKLVVQGRYSPEADGMELKERGVRRAVATRMGAKPGSNELLEPLDFTASGTSGALEKLYAERFGKAALGELEKDVAAGKVKPRLPPENKGKRDRDPGMFTRMVDSLRLYKIIPGGRSPEESILWAGELYNRLVENEKIADKALLELAEQRAQAIMISAEQAQIPRDRVGGKPSEPFTGGEAPGATLLLDAL